MLDTTAESARETDRKEEQLHRLLRSMEKVLLAFSGGRDSLVLLAEAVEALGTAQVLAVTVRSEIRPPQEFETARAAAEKYGVRHAIVETDELALPAFRPNRSDRCRICKAHMFRLLRSVARANGIAHVVDGLNATEMVERDELLQVPPELGVRSPLAEAGLSRHHVRTVSAALGLAPAPKVHCLASRVSMGIPLSAGLLEQVRAAESMLCRQGFREAIVRVHSDGLARIKVPIEELSLLIADGKAQDVAMALSELGFSNTAVDLGGV